MKVTYAELAILMGWMNGGTREPERALLVKVLLLAASDPMCPVKASWPILRMARHDPIGELRRPVLMFLWSLACAAVVRAQCAEFAARATEREALKELKEKLRTVSPMRGKVLRLLCDMYESGESRESILQVLRWFYPEVMRLPS